MIYNKYNKFTSKIDNQITRRAAYFILRPYLRKKERQYWNNVPIFSQVEIETVNRCNGECQFCPVNRNEKQRPYARMTEELFDKITDELSEIEYRGWIGLHSNNEPFIDQRIVDFAKKTREKVPNAFIHIYSNGSLCNRENVAEIMKYLDRLIIDNYSDEFELSENSKIIDEMCKENQELNSKIEIHMRKKNEQLYSRGGQSPNKENYSTLKLPCLNPYNQFVIRPDGKVSLCCNDALGKMTMGDCNYQSILDIWKGKPYQDIRSKLIVGREYVDICKYCDTFSTLWL